MDVIFNLSVVTYNEHLKNILSHILDSYHILTEIEDKPGDLAKIEKEMLKINGFIKVVSNKIDIDKIPRSDFGIVKTKFAQYLENYSFEKEIKTMASLYSNDMSRVKNMRLKILESLKNKHMIDDVKELMENLWLIKKNVFYVVVKIISWLDVLNIFQKNVTVITIDYFRLGPDLSWKFKQHLHSFSIHSDSLWWSQIPHSQLLDISLVWLFRLAFIS